MKKSGTRSLVQGVLVVAALAVIAIPLSSLMVADASAVSDTSISVNVQQTQPVSSVEMTDDAEVSSAVSSLMAGSAVGPTRGAILAPRNPASAFVPF